MLTGLLASTCALWHLSSTQQPQRSCQNSSQSVMPQLSTGPHFTQSQIQSHSDGLQGPKRSSPNSLLISWPKSTLYHPPAHSTQLRGPSGSQQTHPTVSSPMGCSADPRELCAPLQDWLSLLLCGLSSRLQYHLPCEAFLNHYIQIQDPLTCFTFLPIIYLLLTGFVFSCISCTHLDYLLSISHLEFILSLCSLLLSSP